MNVASVEGAEVSGDQHFVGLPGLLGARGSGMAFPVLGLPLDGSDLWNFDHMDSRGPSLISDASSDPPAPSRIRQCSGMSSDCRVPSLIREQGHYMCGRDLVLLGLSSLVTLAWAPDGPGWGPGVHRRVRIDDDITNKLSQTISQHNGKLLLRVLFCDDIASVLRDVALGIGIGISWDSLIHCWGPGM